MWKIKHILGRTLIWLAAIAVPLQGMPSVSCGCQDDGAPHGKCCPKTADSSSCCCAARDANQSRCCRSSSTGRCRCTGAAVCRCGARSKCHNCHARSCCSRERRPSCCATNGENCCQHSSCTCGPFCNCKASPANDLPPVAPPTSERTPSDQFASSLLTSVTTGLIPPPPTVALSPVMGDDHDAASGLPCCIRLSRFML